MAITVVGSVALDSIKSDAGSVELAVGGSAIHFANAASLGSRVHVIGVVGDDFSFSRLDFLEKRGVDLTGIEVVSGGKTFFWKGRYEDDMNKAISEVTELNVFEGFSPVLDGERRAAGFLFLANIHPVLQKHVVAQRGTGTFTILDSMNYWIKNARVELASVIPLVDGVVLNDQEIKSFTGENCLVAAGRKLLQMGPSCVIIKKGEHGVLALGRDWVVALPAFPLDRIVDPTGAGDSFAGGLVGYLDMATGGDRGRLADAGLWKKALAWATCVASFNVQAFSIEGIAACSRADIIRRYGEYRKVCQIEGDLDVS